MVVSRLVMEAGSLGKGQEAKTISIAFIASAIVAMLVRIPAYVASVVLPAAPMIFGLDATYIWVCHQYSSKWERMSSHAWRRA